MYDPVAEPAEAQHEYGIALTDWDALPPADALIAAVSHKELLARPLSDLTSRIKPGGCFIDVKSQYDRAALEQAGFTVWRL